MTDRSPTANVNATDGSTIIDMRTRVASAPTSEPVKLSFGSINRRIAVLVEIELVNGIVGFGESWVNWPPWACSERLAAYEQGIRPRIVGRNAQDIDGINDLLSSNLLPMGQQAGAIGPIAQAISGVDLALWDVAGKLAGISVTALCGGGGSAAPVYASSIGPGSDIGRSCRDLMARGFTGVKVRVGFDYVTDRNLVEQVRTCVGDEFNVIADANQAWSLDEADHMAKILSGLGVELIEEPLKNPGLENFERLYECSGVRIAIGENVYDEEEYSNLASSSAIAALQPDVTKNGGFSFARRIGAIAAANDCALMPHCYGGPLGFLASVHLLAGLEIPGAVEFPIGPAAPLWEMVLGAPPVDDGKVETPPGPGFGFHPRDDWLVRGDAALASTDECRAERWV